MIEVLAIHGVNTPQYYDFALDWERALGCKVRSCRWESTGTVSGDVTRMVFNRKYRKRQVEIVAERIYKHQAMCREARIEGVIVAHSMGEPLAFAAERLLRVSGLGTVLNYISLGGPIGHPAWGGGLRAVGLGKPIAQTPTRFWNRDDGVCCTRLGWTVNPSWCINERVAVAGETRFFVEHPAEMYLANENVKRTIYDSARMCGPVGVA